jgi:hypothetical protein
MRRPVSAAPACSRMTGPMSATASSSDSRIVVTVPMIPPSRAGGRRRDLCWEVRRPGDPLRGAAGQLGLGLRSTSSIR